MLANHKRMALLSPKMRWKVGSIVSRSRSVSFTSKTINGRAAMSGSCSSTLSALLLEPVAVRSLLGAIAADLHAAPPSPPPSRMVGEHQRAAMSLTGFDVGEVFFTHKLRQRLADRQQQRVRRSPAPHHLQLEAIAAVMAISRYPAERLVTRQEPVQRLEFVQRLRRERPAHMLMNEGSEPLAQISSLIRDFVQFTWHRSCLQLSQCTGWHKLGLSHPLQETIAAVEPVHRRVDRRRDGVQEIKAERVGNEHCRRSVLHGWP